jgi:DNA-binding response OmpR family regulator
MEERMETKTAQLKALVVDDDFMERQVVGRLLRAQGFQTMHASNGEDALLELVEQPFDLMVCNVHLPRINGVQLLRSVHTAYPRLRVILFTTFFDEGLREMVINWGAADLLRKPVVAEQLLEAVAPASRREQDTGGSSQAIEAEDALGARQAVSNEAAPEARGVSALGRVVLN